MSNFFSTSTRLRLSVPLVVPDQPTPKHLKRYGSGMNHCCFAGCTPMGCPGGCCVQEFGHRAECPLNPTRQWDEADHEIYIANNGRKHLFTKGSSAIYHWNPRLQRPRYFCPSCRDEVSYPGNCGPSGCINVPA